MKTSVLRGLVVVALCLVVGGVRADTFNWDTLVSTGFFEDPVNWTETGAPVDAADIAQFLGAGTHTVDFRDSFFQQPVAWTNVRTLIGTGGGNDKHVTFELGGGSYTLTADGTFGSAGLRIGDSGTGSLTVTNGTFATGSFILGQNTAGNGTLTVTGPNTTWNAGGVPSAGQSIADAGTGTLNVLEGATVTMAGLDIGRTSTSVGEVLLSGNSTMTNSGLVSMARLAGATATATVEQGATWEMHDLRSGLATSQSTFIVDDATVRVKHTGLTELNGTTIIRNGGLFQDETHGVVNIHQSLLIESQGRMIVTNHINSEIAIYGGTMEVRGTNSLLHMSRYLSVLGAATEVEGVLLVTEGGVVRSNADVMIGRVAGRAGGRIEVTGTGSRLESLSIGIHIGGVNWSTADAGPGVLTLRDGGVADATGLRMRVHGTGTLEVDGGEAVVGRLQLLADSVFHVTLHSAGAPIPVTSKATGGGGDNSGNLTIDPAAVFALSLAPGFSAAPQQEFTIVLVEGAITGTFKDIAEGARITTPEGYEFLASYSGGANDKSFTLTVDVIPEPGVLGLLGVAGMVLYAVRRRFY